MSAEPAVAGGSVAAKRSPWRVGFDLARAGNFPSVASNVLAALVLTSQLGMVWPGPRTLILAILAGCLIYAGGATFNDVADAAFDAKHKKDRAIPSGAISRAAASRLATIEMMLGVGILIASGASMLWVFALVLTILAYDAIHKKWVGSVILMAGCRVLLAFSVASLPLQAMSTAFYAWVGALFVYIVSLSLIARWEYEPGAPAAKIGKQVGRMLAFIPLIDALALALVGAWLPALACACAVPLGRWAQRLAAAT